MTTGQVLRRSALASFGYGVLFAGSLPFLCLLGVPPTIVLVALLGRQLDGVIEGRSKERDNKLRGGLFVFLFVLLVVFASIGGSTAAGTLLPTMADDPRSTIGVVVALSVALAIALPYAFVPLVQRDGAVPSGVGGHAFVLAAQAMTRVPLGRRLGLVALAVVTQALPLGVFLFVEDRDFLLAIGAALGGYAVLVPIASAHLVAAYASVRDELEGDPFDDEPVAVPSSLRAAGVSALLAVGALLFLVAEALLVPLPMAVGEVQAPLEPVPGTQPIPIGDGSVLVRSSGAGVTVAARDGGGAGFVAADCGEVEHVAVEPVEDGTYRIVAVCGVERTVRVLHVDARGVRLDDSFGDRVDARISGWFWFVCALSLLLWIVAFGGPWRAFQRARYLRSLRGTDELDHAPGVRALEGTLHAEEPVHLADGRFRSAGSAQVSGGALRITLPAEGPALGKSDEVLHDGAEVAVVGHFDELVGGGFRDGPAPWPADGLLVPGGRRAAAERLTRPAARRLALLFGGVTLAQLVAAAILVLGW